MDHYSWNTVNGQKRFCQGIYMYSISPNDSGHIDERVLKVFWDRWLLFRQELNDWTYTCCKRSPGVALSVFTGLISRCVKTAWSRYCWWRSVFFCVCVGGGGGSDCTQLSISCSFWYHALLFFHVAKLSLIRISRLLNSVFDGSQTQISRKYFWDWKIQLLVHVPVPL